MLRAGISVRVLAVTSLCISACSGGDSPSPSVRGLSPATSAITASPRPDPGQLRVPTAGWATDFTIASIDLGEISGGGPPKDGIPAIDVPRYESIPDARVWLQGRSPVIALQVGPAVRAYPLAILMWHEIANDVLGGTPVVVTFCPLCNAALVFERSVGDVTYDFGTTGNLRHSDLVMYDRQTESWWQQATGQAIVGEKTGTSLTFLPAQIISFADFEATYPEGDVLARDTGHERDYGRNPYVGYDTLDQNPFLFYGVVDGRLPPKERVVSVGSGAGSVAFPFSELRAAGVASAQVDGADIVAFWGPGTASALEDAVIDDGADVGSAGVFEPTVDGRRLTFVRDGGEDAPIRDAETGSTWSVTGRATAGELAGSQLVPVVHGEYFWFAWAAFVPETVIWLRP